MKMGTVLAVLFFSVAFTLPGVVKTLADAYRNGAMSKVVYRIVDDRGIVVSNAIAYIWYRSYGRPQDNADWNVLSDENGVFVAEHRTNEKLSVYVYKDGYYGTRDAVSYFDSKKSRVSNGKWLPYGAMKTLVLKRILNPTKMCSSEGLDYYKYLPPDQWGGFDLQKREWVSPWGGGEHADMLVRFTNRHLPDGYYRTMEVSFTNNPFAGVCQLKTDDYSEMNSVYHADTNAVYTNSLLFEVTRNGRGVRRLDLEEGQYLVFRTRTQTNKVGALVSAHYGKIYGNWRFGERGGMAIQKIEFNPIPNDTNLEDKATADYSRKCRRQWVELMQ